MEKVAATLLLLLYLTSAQQEQCGSIGNNDETAATASRAQMFYLDTANPAPCTGNVTSWRVCYYGPDSVNNRGSYWATYAVYRRTGSDNSSRYDSVSEMFRAIRTVSDFITGPIVDGEIAQGGFNCYTDSIDVGSSPLTIQAGDILGACIFDPDDIPFVVTRLPLDVVGEASGESLLRMGTTGCSREDIPSDIPASQLSTINSRRLHIYANIEREPTATQIVSVPSTTTVAATTATTSDQLQTPVTIESSTTTVSATGSKTTTSSSLVSADSTIELSMVEVTKSVPNNEGIQTSSRIIAIAAGSVCGGLLVLPLLVVIMSAFVCLKSCAQKWKVGNPSTVAYSSDENVNTETNVAYKPVLHTVTVINAGFEVKQGSTERQKSMATENLDSKLDMEQNVAYGSSTDTQISPTSNGAYSMSENTNMEDNVAYESSNGAQISLSANIAYYKSGRQLEENDYENDLAEYDYIKAV